MSRRPPEPREGRRHPKVLVLGGLRTKAQKQVTMSSVDEESIHTSILLQTRVMYRYLAYRNLCLEKDGLAQNKYIDNNDDE